MKQAVVAIFALPLAGCISVEITREGPPAPPSYAAVEGAPVPARARLYADCLGQAIETGTYDHVRDDGTELIRFSCAGAPARAFYEALGPRSATIGSEFAAGPRTWRSTNVILEDLFGADYCWTENGEYGCHLNFNAGGFLVD